MIAIAGIALEVDAENPEDAEALVLIYLETLFNGTLESDSVKPMKLWTAADFDTDTRDAGFKYKDMRCRLDPEYGLTKIGRVMLTKRMDEHAQAQAQKIAEAQVSDN